MMKAEKLTRGLDRLIADIKRDSSLDRPGHLTDEEFALHAANEASTEARARIEGHLARCEECALELEEWRRRLEEWLGDDGAKRLDAFEKRLLAAIARANSSIAEERPGTSVFDLAAYREKRARLAIIVGQDLGPLPHWSREAAATIPQESATADGRLSWQLRAVKDGSVSVAFSSRKLPAGTRIYLFRVGTAPPEILVRETTLKPIMESGALNEVGAEVKLLAREVAELPKDEKITFEVLTPEDE
jgi:hypothetical protein